MKKKMLRWSALLLVCLFALTLAPVALAEKAEDYTVLNVVFAPGSGDNRKGINSTEDVKIVFNAYKIAEAEKRLVEGENGMVETIVYTITDEMSGISFSNDDLNELLKGEQTAAASNEIMNAFGTYINDRSKTENPVLPTATSEPTQNLAIGAGQTSTDGVARFSKLEDGLYIIACQTQVWLNGVRYTAAPFLLNIPYVSNGIVNNYLTARVKFATYTPPAPDPEVIIPDEPTPENPDPDLDIDPDPIPLPDMPDLPDEPDLEIPDDDVPLDVLPQTGQLWWPVPIMCVLGVALIVTGVCSRKKTGKVEDDA